MFNRSPQVCRAAIARFVGSGGKGIYGTGVMGLGDMGSRGAKEFGVIPIRNDRRIVPTSIILVTTNFLNDRGCIASTFHMTLAPEAGIRAGPRRCTADMSHIFATNSVRHKRSLIM